MFLCTVCDLYVVYISIRNVNIVLTYCFPALRLCLLPGRQQPERGQKCLCWWYASRVVKFCVALRVAPPRVDQYRSRDHASWFWVQLTLSCASLSTALGAALRWPPTGHSPLGCLSAVHPLNEFTPSEELRRFIREYSRFTSALTIVDNLRCLKNHP